MFDYQCLYPICTGKEKKKFESLPETGFKITRELEGNQFSANSNHCVSLIKFGKVYDSCHTYTHCENGGDRIALPRI